MSKQQHQYANCMLFQKFKIQLINCLLDFDCWTLALIVCVQDRQWLSVSVSERDVMMTDH